MTLKWTTLLAATLLVTPCDLALAQAPPATDLTIDVADAVEYRADIADITKFGRNTEITPALAVGTGPAQTPNFALNTGIADIVAVNGQPAKGLLTYRARAIGATPNPAPGRAIADVTRLAIREDVFEILMPDGMPVGSIMTFGLSGGSAPPGQPPANAGSFAIGGEREHSWEYVARRKASATIRPQPRWLKIPATAERMEEDQAGILSILFR